MAINNPLSGTHFKATKNRLQHYANDYYACTECRHQYHPMVHSQPYVIQFGAILIGLAIFVVFKTQAPPWLYGVMPVAILAYMFWYRSCDRRIASDDKPIRYGQIILECPECGCKDGNRC